MRQRHRPLRLFPCVILVVTLTLGGCATATTAPPGSPNHAPAPNTPSHSTAPDTPSRPQPNTTGLPSPDPASPASLQGELTVFAAASLTEAFTDIGHSFEAEHPEVTVSFQFDGSSTLAHQILEGAPADVFAAADQATMRAVTSQNAVDEATVFALNDLVVAVPADNPARIDSLDDLSGPSVTTLTCTPETPCGAIANRVLSIADLTLTPSSLEPNVAAVASKLRMGEADAGFVYATDVRVSGGELTQIDWPDDQAIRHAAATECPVGVVRGSQHLDLARHFIEFVQSPRGTTALAQAGFRQP